jgi:elongation factor Ts
MAVTAQLVKDLREKTGAGMMDCKKALTATNGDLEAAVDWLRKKGIASAAKKAGRVAAEGKVLALTEGTRGILLEVNTETDFAAKSEKFIAFADTVAQMVLDGKPADMDALNVMPYPGSGRPLSEEVKHQIGRIGENMDVRRFTALEVSQGVIGAYIHMGGKIGTLVALESSGPTDALVELGKKLAMHVAASAPAFLDRASVTQQALDREKAILSEQAKASGKPDNIIEKMVVGRLNKFYGDVCLMEQPLAIDPDQQVGKMVQAAAKEMGTPIKVTAFVRYGRGEGIEKPAQDLAQEVAAQLAG